MEQKELFDKVVKILTPYAKDKTALAKISENTNILDELKVNSARLVDVVLEFEDAFGIEIADDDVDGIATIGDCVDLISKKAA
jgi:acyl carrier protein